MTKEKTANLIKICMIVYAALRILSYFNGTLLFPLIKGDFHFAWYHIFNYLDILFFGLMIVMYLLIRKGEKFIPVLSFIVFGLFVLSDVVYNIIWLIIDLVQGYFSALDIVITVLGDLISVALWAALQFVLCVLVPKLISDVLNEQPGSYPGAMTYAQSAAPYAPEAMQGYAPDYAQAAVPQYEAPAQAPADYGQQGGYGNY